MQQKRTLYTLFDDFPRTDPAHMYETESLFHFLNRRAGTYWDSVRSEAETWYRDFPDHDRDLRNRFRQDSVGQHLPAWWELYTHRLFSCLGYKIDVHPTLTGTRKKPDFLVSHGSESMYVESATVLNRDDIHNPDGQAWVCQCVDEAQSPDFTVHLEFEKVGTGRPVKRKIIEKLEAWLAALDWAAARTQLESSWRDSLWMDSPEWRWRQPLPQGWVLDYRAIPVPPDKRGMPGRRISVYPTPSPGFTDDAAKLRETLENKGSKYSSLDRPLDKPLIVAIQFWRSVDVFDIKRTLFGS